MRDMAAIKVISKEARTWSIQITYSSPLAILIREDSGSIRS